MDMPKNRFKAGLKAGRQQIGIWNSIPGMIVPELLAVSGFDWVLVDAEHTPIELSEVQTALQAIAGFPEVSAVVRPYANDTVLIKRVLDMGAQSILLPCIESRAEAEAAVRAVRYGPRGVRGVAGITRASRYGHVENYVARASDEICLILQVETRAGLEALDDIAGVEGVDGIFIGPADLSASLGYPGDPHHPDVSRAIEGAVRRLRELGKPSGILYFSEAQNRQAMAWGTTFTAVGADIGLLAAAARALRASYA